MDVDDFLEHYGTKGMRWGVRKASKPRPAFMPPVKSTPGKPKWQSPPPKKAAAPTPSAPKAVKRSLFGKQKSPKVISEEALQFREIRAKAKKNGVQALSNKELELVNKRLELQSKYNKAFPKKKSPLSFATDVLIDNILMEAGERRINEYVGPRSPDAAVMVRNAIAVGRVVKAANKAKNDAKNSKK